MKHLIPLIFLLHLANVGNSQCNQVTSITHSIVTQSCPSGTVTYQLTYSSSVANGNNSVCYGYTVTSPGGGQQTTNFGPVNQKSNQNNPWVHVFNVTINCNQGLTLFLTAWANPDCGGQACPAQSITVMVSPLPVELFDFKVQLADAGHLLEWSTAKEINNDGFYVEFSMDIEEWKTLQFVKGAGNTTQKTRYVYFYETSEKGMTYYRLKQIDFDGTAWYSDHITLKSFETKIRLNSALVRDEISVFSPNDAKGIIVDVFGKFISSFYILDNFTSLDVSGLTPGTYLLLVENEQPHKFIKY